ncbi:MAG: pyridoxal phosphate-dependent aminotransferase [Gammaproteobacteria bacterium]|nr:pyridoxal phosphate-dependent aminotransferase [Gammaproteobacteria bacterium]MYD76020.1 pyridoxal phosphate-dependent aminotransferase [Gammaproteobacteria bacterium]
MKFASLTHRIAGESVDAWQVHYEGLARLQAGEDIIVLSVGQETDEHTDGKIVEAAVASLRSGRHHYTPVEGDPALRAAVARRHRELTGQDVDEHQCAIFSGAQNALFAVSQCLLEHGDEVILIEPYYTTYPATFSAGGAKVVPVAVNATRGMQMVPEDVIGAITDRTRAIVVNSPNNPLGSIYTLAQYRPIVEACIDRNIWLVSDEVYQEILLPEDRSSPASLPGAEEICITVSSLSKSHRMTGWRIGWAIGPRALMDHLYNLSMCMTYGLPPFSMDAALVAFQTGSSVADAVRTSMDRRRRIAIECLRDIPGLRLLDSSGGMFVVLDVRESGIGSREFARQMLDRHRVSLLPCDGFGASGTGLVRVSLCVEDGIFEQACLRIREFALQLSEA